MRQITTEEALHCGHVTEGPAWAGLERDDDGLAMRILAAWADSMNVTDEPRRTNLMRDGLVNALFKQAKTRLRAGVEMGLN